MIISLIMMTTAVILVEVFGISPECYNKKRNKWD